MRGNGSHFLGPFTEPGKWLSVAGAPGCACLRCLQTITFWPARRVYRAGLTLILYVVPITIPWRRCVTYLVQVCCLSGAGVKIADIPAPRIGL